MGIVADANWRNCLAQALGGAKPFRNFKNTLCSYPVECEQWFKYKEGV